MSRKLRGSTDKGETCHVISTVNRRACGLKWKKIKALFIKVVQEAKEHFDFEIDTFCIMDNHFHLLITPALGESLSRIMKWIKQVFAVRWNKKHNTTGHFWGDRFWSRKIVDENDFWTVFEYIEQNPVKAGLVAKAEDWEYSGAYHRYHGITLIVSEVTQDFWDKFHARLRL
jgi:REP element-mobilizing transposase RayT